MVRIVRVDFDFLKLKLAVFANQC